MIKIYLKNPETGETNYYEQNNVSFGEFKDVLNFNKKNEKMDLRKKILTKKLESDTPLTGKEEKELMDLTGNDDDVIDRLEELVAKLFKNPKVTVESIDKGLGADGIMTLKDILADAMGGIEADADHPAKK